DLSTPSTEPGKPRSWTGSTSDPTWFGGNLSFESLRTLASLIRRVSDKEGRQMDEWDYKAGWEPYAREYVKQLRASQLSLSGLKRLIEMRENEIAAEETRQAQSAMTPEDIRRSKEADAVVERNKKIEKLGGDLLTSFSTALKDIKMGKDEFTKL